MATASDAARATGTQSATSTTGATPVWSVAWPSAGASPARGVLEVRAAGGDRRVGQPPAASAVPIPHLRARGGGLAVVAVREVPVGVVVRDADERVPRRVDRGHDLARAVARLELPRGEREVARVAADLQRPGGGEVAPPEPPDDGRAGADLPAEPRHEHRDAVDEVPPARLAREAAGVVGVHPCPAVRVLRA